MSLAYPRNKIKIIFVDNGSTDDSVHWVEQKFHKIKIIRNKVNLGFAAANNIGIRESLKDRKVRYIITLNNDTEVSKSWLIYLVNFMEKNQNVGIAVGKILQLSNHKRIDSVGDAISRKSYRIINRGHNELDQGQYELPTEVFSACAAASIFRRESLEEAKYNGEFFDSDFISYVEDVDLNTRIRLMGWLIYYVPSAVVYHIGSATSSKISREYKEFLSRRNRILMAIKNFPLKYTAFLVFRYLLPSSEGFIYYFENKLKKTYRKGVQHYVKKSFKFYFRLLTKKLIKGDEALAIFEISVVQIKAIFGVIKLLPKTVAKRFHIQKMRKISNSEVERWFKELSI